MRAILQSCDCKARDALANSLKRLCRPLCPAHSAVGSRVRLRVQVRPVERNVRPGINCPGYLFVLLAPLALRLRGVFLAAGAVNADGPGVAAQRPGPNEGKPLL